MHWFACCVSIDGLDISSNGGRVGDGTNREDREEMRSEVLVGCAHIFWRGWVAQPIFGLIAEARSPLLPLPALPQPPPRTGHNHAFVVLQLLDPGDREPQYLPVCLMCVCSSLCSSGAVFCNACVAHMMKNWNKTGLNTMKSRMLQSNPHTSGFQLPRLQAAP